MAIIVTWLTNKGLLYLGGVLAIIIRAIRLVDADT